MTQNTKNIILFSLKTMCLLLPCFIICNHIGLPEFEKWVVLGCIYSFFAMGDKTVE